MKLKNAAQMTASCGCRTRVATTVAIELAASCRPFRKSNSSATAISADRMGRPSAEASIGADSSCAPGGTGDQTCLAVMRLDGVGDVVALVDDVLDELVELLAVDVADGVDGAGAQLGAQLGERRGRSDSSARPSIWPICSHSAKMALWSRATESRYGMTLRSSSALSTIASAIARISRRKLVHVVALDALGGVLDQVDRMGGCRLGLRRHPPPERLAAGEKRQSARDLDTGTRGADRRLRKPLTAQGVHGRINSAHGLAPPPKGSTRRAFAPDRVDGAGAKLGAQPGEAVVERLVGAPLDVARPSRVTISRGVRAAPRMRCACSQKSSVKLTSGGIRRLNRLSDIGHPLGKRGEAPVAAGHPADDLTVAVRPAVRAAESLR